MRDLTLNFITHALVPEIPKGLSKAIIVSES